MPGAGDDTLIRCLARVIAGSGSEPPLDGAAALLDLAAAHRVDVLLAHHIGTNPARHHWPTAITRRLAERLRAAVVATAVRDAECVRVFSALAAAGVRAVVFKGAALAHTVYPHSYLRQRADTDVLVAKRDLPEVTRTLLALGYGQPAETSGSLITHQCHFDKTESSGIVHAWDVHWKVVNVHAAADALSHAEICADGTPIAALGGAIAPSPVVSLMLSCIHRVTHHGDAPDLVWLLDLHLLAARLDADDWTRLIDLARVRGVWTACARSLARTFDLFATAVPAAVEDAVAKPGIDATARFLQPGLRQIDVVRADLAALPTWTARCQMIREHVFPPAAFMVARYGVRNRAALPWWYVRRICTGGPRWFRRRTS